MARFFLALLTLLAVAATPLGGAAAEAPCAMTGASAMAGMSAAPSQSAPLDKCCDPVTKACHASCAAINGAFTAAQSAAPLAGRAADRVAVAALDPREGDEHEPGWTDPPPKAAF